MKKLNVAILGAGNIARAMAEAVNGIPDDAVLYAIASRDLEKSEAFKKAWGVKKAYGSYEEMVKDPEIDLVYVATPHSHHYEHAKLCIENGKSVLVEKAFTGNVRQAEEILALAKEKNVFVTEAIWTRYLPARHIVKELIESDIIGEITSLNAEFSVPLSHLPRMYDPALAGGTLLDLGMYALTFASMYFGDDIVKVESECTKLDTGVDATDDIYYTYKDGRTAHLRSCMVDNTRNEGIFFGSKGKIVVSTLNNYDAIKVYDSEGTLIKSCPIPPQVNGYEYEVLACKKAIEEGKLECAEMPHDETIEIMRQMDKLRADWGVVYPFD